MIVCAVLFLVVIFLTKNQTIFENADPSLNQTDGLIYTNTPIGELVSRDTDSDGILDWEEGLWGTDPTKVDTDDDGVNDAKEIDTLKTETVGSAGSNNANNIEKLKLTETDKFSDQFFSTVAALTQSGSLDELTIDQVSTSLAENIQKHTPKKIYTVKNIKISTDESRGAIQAYNTKLQALQVKYPFNADITAIILESLTIDEEIDLGVLKKFDPIIAQLNSIIKEMLTISPPKSLSVLHVMVINGFQKLSENMTDMKLIDTDSIVAFSAISQYPENADLLFQYINQLTISINQKLNN